MYICITCQFCGSNYVAKYFYSGWHDFFFRNGVFFSELLDNSQINCSRYSLAMQECAGIQMQLMNNTRLIKHILTFLQ